MIGQHLSHYHIVAKLGAGGMGVVYRAEDTRLGRQVAIKVISKDLAEKESAWRRFQLESRAASSLNHPNICTLYDIGEHEGQAFLVMELLEGHTLAKVLRDGPLTTERLLALGSQAADALAAAHGQGIIHRDIKPANLFVTNRSAIKVLDFGLAKLTRESASDGATTQRATSMSKPGSRLGTVGYMSPEQARGETLDPRTDIFSLGSVLYEMATGQRPFPGQSEAETLAQILEHGLAPPSQLNPEIPTELDRIILGALEKDRKLRTQGADELRAELDRLRRDSSASGGAPVRQERDSRTRRWVAGAALLALVAIGLIWTQRSQDEGVTPTGEAVEQPESDNVVGRVTSEQILKRRPTVGVLGFKNLTGLAEVTWLSTALSEMLTTELAVGGELRTIAGESIAQAEADLSLGPDRSYTMEDLDRLSTRLGCDYVVIGSYTALGDAPGDPLRLDLRLRGATGEIRLSLSETGTEAELLRLVTRSGERLREALGAAELSVEETAAVRASLPNDANAARLFTEALERLRQYDALGAKNLLEQVVEIEPEHARTHAVLAEAWLALGNEDKALVSAERAFRLSGLLPERDRLLIEASYRMIENDHERAMEAYGKLFAEAPDDLDMGLHLALAQRTGGKVEDALATAEKLRALPAPLGSDPRIDVEEATATSMLGDFERALTAARRAEEKARLAGNQLVLGAGLLLQSYALRNLGDLPEAYATALEAHRIFVDAGARNEVARALNFMAIVRWRQGDLDACGERLEEALAVFREIGARTRASIVLNNLGVLASQLGDLETAKRRYEEFLRVARDVGAPREVALGLGNLASVSATQGELIQARDAILEALSIDRGTGDRSGMVLRLRALGGVRLSLGDLTGARGALDEAITLCRESGDQAQLGDALTSAGYVLLEQGYLDEAREHFDEALVVGREIGNELVVGEARVGLAQVAIESDLPSDAESLARKAVDSFGEDAPTNAASALGALAVALTAQRKFSEAREVMVDAQRILRDLQHVGTGLWLDLDLARVETGAGDVDKARQRLQGALSDAIEMGYLTVQLHARLLLAELDAADTPNSGQDAFEELERDARALGFGLVARKAAAATP